MPAPLAYVLEVQGQAEASAEVDRFGNAIEESDKKAEKATQTTKSMSMSILQAGAGFATAATGAVGLYYQFDNLEKASLRVDMAQKNLTSAEATLASARESLRSLTEKGVSTGDAYHAAVLRVQAAEEQLAIATQKVDLAQGDLTESHLGFALNVLPTVFGAIHGVQGALAILRGAKIANTAAEVASSAATAGSIPIFAAQTAAKITAAGATNGLTLATRLLQIAMGPVGWVILGVSGFLALFATNAFGVRDAINAAGKAIGDAIPIIRPLLDMLGNIANALFPQTKDESEKMKTGVTTDLQQVGAQFGEFESQTTASASIVQTSIKDMSDQSSVAVDNMARAVGAAAGQIVTDAQRIESAMQRAKNAVGGFTSSTPVTLPVAGTMSSSTTPPGFSWIGFGNELAAALERKKNNESAGMTTSTAGGATPFAHINIEIKLDSATIARHMADARDGDLLKFT